MTLGDLGAVGELVGGLAVIISLLYVGLQIKQSAAASRAATTQAFSKQYSDLNQMIVGAGISDIFARGMAGLDGLDKGERVSFMAVLSSISRTLESFYMQKEKGDLDSRLLEGWFLQYMDLHANPGVQEFWEIRKHQYSADFVRFLEDRIGQRTAKPLYTSE